MRNALGPDFAATCQRIAETDLKMVSSSLLTEPLTDAFDACDFGELSDELALEDALNMPPVDICSKYFNTSHYNAGVAVPGDLHFLPPSTGAPVALAPSFQEPSDITVDAIPFYCENAADQWPASLQGYLPPLPEYVPSQQLGGLALGASGNARRDSLSASDRPNVFMPGRDQETLLTSAHKYPRLEPQQRSYMSMPENDPRLTEDAWIDPADIQCFSPSIQKRHYQALAMRGWVPDVHFLKQQVQPTQPSPTSTFCPPPGPHTGCLKAHADSMPLEV